MACAGSAQLLVCLPLPFPPRTLSHPIHSPTGGRVPRAPHRHVDGFGSARPTTLLPPYYRPARRPSSPATYTLAHTYALESHRGATPAQPGYCLIVQRNTGALLGPLRPTLFRVLAVVVRRVSPFLNQVLQQAVRNFVAGLKCLFQNVGDLARIAHAASCWSAPGPGFRRGCMARRGAWRAVRFASLRSAAAGERWANHAGRRLASGGCRSRRPWSERFE